MTIELEAYRGLPCEAQTFKINGEDAELEEFGEYEYGDYAECQDEDIRQWGCYNKYFVPLPYEKNMDVADKYWLTEEEYDELCDKLREKFAIGTCGWCV